MKKLIMLTFISLTVLLSSCLNDSGYLDIYEKKSNGPVVSFGQNDEGTVTRTVEVDTEPQSISVNVNVARATSDVTVTIEVDPSVLAGSTYEQLPDSTYSIPTSTVTIPKGTLDVPFTFQVTSSKISLDYSYALPLVIKTSTAGTTIATNLSTALVVVGVKNDLDGIWKIVGGSITRNSATGPDLSLGGNYPAGLELTLETKDANSATFQVLKWKDGSTVGGVDFTFITVNRATNDVIVDNTTNASMKNTTGKPSTYTPSEEPTERRLLLNFDWGTSPSDRIIGDLQLEWVRQRP